MYKREKIRFRTGNKYCLKSVTVISDSNYNNTTISVIADQISNPYKWCKF